MKKISPRALRYVFVLAISVGLGISGLSCLSRSAAPPVRRMKSPPAEAAEGKAKPSGRAPRLGVSRKRMTVAPPSMAAPMAAPGTTGSVRPQIVQLRETIEKQQRQLQQVAPQGARISKTSQLAQKVCALSRTICRASRQICKLTRQHSLSDNDCRETTEACRQSGQRCPSSLRKSFEIDM